MEENAKCFLTYDEQLSKLREKKLIIKNEEYAIYLLKQCSYFNIISGYKGPFKQKNLDYKKNTCIEDIYALYHFDNELRNILMKYILIVEIHVKSLISYYFCEKFGDSQSEYLNVNNYNYSTPKFQEGVNELNKKLNDALRRYSDNEYIKHQKDNYNNVPLWVLVKALTIGSVSKLYSFQYPEIQTKVSKEFEAVNENDLETMLDLLSRFRNVCAHNERLFNFKYKKRSINDMSLHKAFKLNQVKGHYSQGKNDLFACIISLKYLLPTEIFNELHRDLISITDKLFNQTHQIQPLQLYKYMGFPENWKKIKDIQIKNIVNKKTIS